MSQDDKYYKDSSTPVKLVGRYNMTDGKTVWATNYWTESDEEEYNYLWHSTLKLSDTSKYLGLRHWAIIDDSGDVPIEAISVFNAGTGVLQRQIYSWVDPITQNSEDIDDDLFTVFTFNPSET